MFDTISLFTVIGKLILEYGPAIFGWVIAVIVSVYHSKFRSQESKENELLKGQIEQIKKEYEEIKDDYAERIENMNKKFLELNLKHSDDINDISEKRVDDLKELTSDYNTLATNVIHALDKLAVALEVKAKYEKKK